MPEPKMPAPEHDGMSEEEAKATFAATKANSYAKEILGAMWDPTTVVVTFEEFAKEMKKSVPFLSYTPQELVTALKNAVLDEEIGRQMATGDATIKIPAEVEKALEGLVTYAASKKAA